VQLFAKINVRNQADRKPYAVILPAPDSSVFDENQEVTPEFGVLCAAKYSILAGTTLIFENGALCGDNS